MLTALGCALTLSQLTPGCRQVHALRGHSGPTRRSGTVCCCAVFPDNTRALTGSADSTAIVWDVSSGKQLLKLDAHMGGVRCCAVAPDGVHVVTGSEDGTLVVWNVDTGRKLQSCEAHTGPQCCTMSYNPFAHCSTMLY